MFSVLPVHAQILFSFHDVIYIVAQSEDFSLNNATALDSFSRVQIYILLVEAHSDFLQ